MNRTQHRRQRFGNRQRGVGFTRQFSSRRARLQHGTDQKLSRKFSQLLDTMRSLHVGSDFDDFLKEEGLFEEVEAAVKNRIEGLDAEDTTFDLLGSEETITETSLEDDESNLLDQYVGWSAKDLSTVVASGNFDGVLTQLREREMDGKSRITVIKAIDARLKDLSEAGSFNTSGVIPPDGVVFGQTTAAELTERRAS